jgi:outer membrane receptor protein involved in Fe transport
VGTAVPDSYNLLGCNPSVGSTLVDRSDEAFFNTPAVTVSLGLQYSIPLPDLLGIGMGEFTPRVEWYYQDETRYSVSRRAFESGVNQQPAYNLWTLRAFWDLADGNTRITAFVSNLSDVQYFNDAIDFADSLGTSGVYVAAPRMWGVTLSYRY